jgi:hypothetical protein
MRLDRRYTGVNARSRELCTERQARRAFYAAFRPGTVVETLRERRSSPGQKANSNPH